MNMTEYLDVKNMTYLEYCAYLQHKYGCGICDYMTPTFNKKRGITRTGEGLYAHHKMEDRVAQLGTPEYAREWPFEWQKKENIIYCDLLEHLWLHTLICKYPSPEKAPREIVGIGGILQFMVPELNDLYSGWETKQAWQKNCHDKVRNDKDTYMAILAEIVAFLRDNKDYSCLAEKLFSSLGEDGTWDKSKNIKIFKEILELIHKSDWE